MRLYQSTILDCTAANFHFTTHRNQHVHVSLAFIDLHAWWFVYLENECIHRFKETKKSRYINVEHAHDIVMTALQKVEKNKF